MKRSIYAFESFHLDAAERLLLRDGEPVSLTPKAFDLLLLLVQNSGRIMEKDVLIGALWSDSIVEESNLTQTIYVLRKTLGEDPQGVKFIETIPKRGYRFVAPVSEIDTEEPALIVEQHTRSRIVIEEEEEGERMGAWENGRTEVQAQLRPFSNFPTQPFSHSLSRRWLWLTATATLATAAIIWVYVSGFRPSASGPPMKTIPLTSFKGVEIFPAFSPDGNQVAFVWNGEAGDNDDIYLRMIGTDSTLRLTDDPGDDISPTWSPDGRHIAFIRSTKDTNAIYLIPALGGPERKLVTTQAAWYLRWAPDGKHLAFSETSPPEPRRIHLLSLETLNTRPLTSLSEPAGHDVQCAFSPDGQTIAFVRFTTQTVADIYLSPVSGGEARRLTFDNQGIYGLDWTEDGRYIVFSSPRGGDYRLWRIAASGGEPEMLFAGGEGVYFPAIARQGRRLAYMQQQFEDTNIWSIEMSGPTGQASPPTQLAFSTRWEEGPDFSPDGRRIAFISLRSGSREVWVCDRNGSNPFKLTSLGGQRTGTPRWSPDGRQIAFDFRPEGYSDIYLISVDGGLPRRLTTDPSHDEAPSWSRDGQWIYFRSKRSGTWQIWKVPAAGGEATQVTRNEGIAAFESSDGRYLYFMKLQAPGIWRMPVGGGEETLILDHPPSRFWGYWTVLDHGLYFANEDDDGNPVIEFYEFATGHVTRIAALDKAKWTGMLQTGLAVSPDAKSILYVQQDGNEGDIILVENFR